MFNKTIFKQTLKSNLKLWIIFTAILTLILFLLVAIFEPATISGMTDMLAGTPLEELLQNTTFNGMMASTFFAIHGPLLQVVFIIMTANSLIAAQIDRGSMAYLLATPIKRSTIVRTQALYLFTALTAMFAVMTGIGLLGIHLFQSSSDIDIPVFLTLILGNYLLMFATSSISFFFSCVFNLSKNSLAFGAGIPLAFFLLHLMGDMSDTLRGMRYLSLNTLFNTEHILSGDSIITASLALVSVGTILYLAGIEVFKRKDLPL